MCKGEPTYLVIWSLMKNRTRMPAKKTQGLQNILKFKRRGYFGHYVGDHSSKPKWRFTSRNSSKTLLTHHHVKIKYSPVLL